MLTEHKKRGYDNPCFVSRKELLRQEVPVKCAKKREYAKASGYLSYKAQEEEHKPKHLRPEYNAWLRDLGTRWQNADQATKDMHAAQQQASNTEHEAADLVRKAQEGQQAGRSLATMLDAFGDHSTPFTCDAFETAVREMQSLGAPSI